MRHGADVPPVVASLLLDLISSKRNHQYNSVLEIAAVFVFRFWINRNRKNNELLLGGPFFFRLRRHGHPSEEPASTRATLYFSQQTTGRLQFSLLMRIPRKLVPRFDHQFAETQSKL